MADTTTANYGFLKPEVGASATTWGAKLNDNFDAIDAQLFKSAGTLNANNLNLSNNPGTAISGTLTFVNATVPPGQRVRWVLAEDTSPEVGGSAGSNLSLSAYSDTGGLLSTPIAINRAAGEITFGEATNFTGLATFADLTATGEAIFADLKATGTATFTGALTPSSTVGIVGTATNDNANAGSVGEVISAVATTAINLNNSIAVNVASISLTPGDWDIYGDVWFTGVISTIQQASINTVSATIAAGPGLNVARAQLSDDTNTGASVVTIRPCRASLATMTTYYLVALAQFTAGGPGGARGAIWARRAR